MKKELTTHNLNTTFGDKLSKNFLLIVLLITLMVVIYREIYIESYENKRFILFLFLFLISMLVLVQRHRTIIMIAGWEFLGLTSLLLIIFYPNKVGSINSLITIMFNRLGDVMIIFVITIIIIQRRITFTITKKIEEYSLLIMIPLIICAITKRAQFPLSSWLPAAISAPTPISAIVHSSTLVTAGIFLLSKLERNLKENNIEMIKLILFIRITTFFIGSLIANIDVDLKKIIAFSTIRQIRIILTFLSLSQINLTITHIINHALFKAILFCTAGTMFLLEMNKQIYNTKQDLKIEGFNIFLLIIRVFNITGLLISSSFYTKDYALERLLIAQERWIFLVITSARLLTIIYCCKISQILKIKIKSQPIQRTKFNNIKTKRIYVLLSLTFSIIPVNLLLWKGVSKVNIVEVLIISLILITPLIKTIKLKRENFKKATESVITVKETIYRFWSKIFVRDTLNPSILREQLIIKRFLFTKKIKENINSNTSRKNKYLLSAIIYLFLLF